MNFQDFCSRLKTKKLGCSSAYRAQLKNPVSICVKILLYRDDPCLYATSSYFWRSRLPLTIGSKILFYAQISRLKGSQILSRPLSPLFTSTSHKRHGSQFMASNPLSYEEGTAVFHALLNGSASTCFLLVTITDLKMIMCR